MAAHRRKNEYRALCWVDAIRCVIPKALEDLPAKVRLHCTFHLPRKRDEDNAVASLKGVLDCLKLKQTGNLGWRFGLYDEKGYFIDDDPDHCEVMKPVQQIDRKNPRLVLVIEDVATEGVSL